MKDEDKTKAELIKELKTLRKERGKSALNDITERKRAEEALQEREEKYNRLFSKMIDGFALHEIICDRNAKPIDYVTLEVNKPYEKILGVKKEAVVGSKASQFMPAKELNEWLELFGPTALMGKSTHYEKYSSVNDKYFEGIVYCPQKNQFAVTFVDITERKQAESELRIERDKLTAIFESMVDGVYITNKNYNIQYVNPVLQKTFGSPEGKKCHEYFHDSDEPCTFCKNEEVFAGKTVRWEWASPKDGKTYDLIDTLIKNADGSISKLEILRDITERKLAEENLRNAKDELQMIMDSVPALIIYKDIEGRIIRANKTMADRFEIPVKDIVGKTIEELVPKEQAENMRKDDKEVIISGKPKRDIIQPYTTPEGIRWTITDKIPYKDKEGKITGVIAFAKDITVQRKAEQKLKQTFQKLKQTMDATIETMSRMIEAKDPYTAGHQLRVSQLTTAIAKELNLSPDKIEGIRVSSLIHDIGKISVPTEILSKSIALTDIEFSLIKSHSQIGYDILNSIDFPFPIAQIVLQHHEKINGSGYPRGLKGDEILLKSKIICVADVVEAMSSHRPYRPALGIDAALEEISKNRGILYDPEVVDVCLKLFKEKGFKFK